LREKEKDEYKNPAVRPLSEVILGIHYCLRNKILYVESMLLEAAQHSINSSSSECAATSAQRPCERQAEVTQLPLAVNEPEAVG
jgi:hypothetical protein